MCFVFVDWDSFILDTSRDSRIISRTNNHTNPMYELGPFSFEGFSLFLAIRWLHRKLMTRIPSLRALLQHIQ